MLFRHVLAGFALAGMLCAGAMPAAAAPVETQVVKTGQGFQLLRDGKPYFVKGAGGSEGSKELLVACGGDSIRTWGVGPETPATLDQAQKLGLTVCVGFWLGHKDQGFNWSNAAAVKAQFDSVRAGIMQYKNHPAVLCWALGNEMEGAGMDTPVLWKAIEDLAKMAHQVDPKHPTMTVVAEIGGQKLQNIRTYCPDIDIVGINSYGVGPSLGARVRAANIGKPYIITEYGPPGTWELGGFTAFGAPPELTSTEKAAKYKETYVKSVAGEPGLCLGSYAFTWGYKIEATATWYGMFLPDGSKLAAVDAMSELWSGKPLPRLCPVMSSLKLLTPDQMNAGDIIKAVVQASDPTGEPIDIRWGLFKEMANYNVQGAGERQTTDFSRQILQNGNAGVEIKAPAPGVYRIYCYIHNRYKSAAVGSIPIKVKGGK